MTPAERDLLERVARDCEVLRHTVEQQGEQVRQLREEGRLQARLHYVSYCCLSVLIAILFALVIVL